MKLATLMTASCGSLLLAGCVPPTDELAPAGAAGFVTEPSPASRGEPFTTDDGWTVRFEELVLQGWAVATPVDETRDGYRQDAEPTRWNARDRTQIFARAMFVGPWRVNVTPFSVYYSPLHRDDATVLSQNVDPKLARRFIEPANDDVIDIGSSGTPVAVMIVRAEKEGRSIRLDAALSRSSTSSAEIERAPRIEVRANALTTLPLTISAERLFLASSRETGAGERVEFEPFAAADADGDGNLTNDELRSATAPCSYCDPEDERPNRQPETLLEILRSRLSAIFVYP